MIRRFALSASVATMLLAGVGAAQAKDSFVIGLSNGWVGSEWRTQMIDEAEAAARAWRPRA